MKSVRKVVLTIIVIFLFFSLSKNIFDYQKNVNFYQSFYDEYQKERKTNITLRTEILKNSNPQELERTLRDKLNLLKPGEITVIIPDPTPTPARAVPTPAPIYQQWLQLFFKPE